MKNLKLISFLLIVLVISSCKKDEDKDDAPNAIVGKWFLKKMVEINYTGDEKTEEAPVTNFGTEDYLQFNTDGTGKISEEGNTDEFTYKVLSNNKLEIIYEGDNGTDETISILKLNSNDLVLFIDQSETYQNIKYRYTVELTLRK
jgi:hypothetical protein